MQRETRVLLLAAALVLVWSVSVFAVSSPKYQMTDAARTRDLLRIAGDPTEEANAVSSGRTFGTPVFVGAAPSASPGLRVGETTYDYQHNGSTGRQVDEFGGLIQVTWMKGTQFSTSLGRLVHWNKAEVTGSPASVTLDNGQTMRALPLGGLGSVEGQSAVTGGNRPGYTTFRNLASGRGVGFMHDAPEEGGGAFWLASVDAAVAVGVFIQNEADQPPGIAAGDEVLWPHGCTDVVGSDTVIHAVARGSSTNTEDPIYYWRGVLSPGGTTITWDDPVFMDTATTISPIVEADPNSDDVVIVYCKPRDITSQINNDVAYFRSTNGGVSWGTNPINVTNYTDDSLNRAYTDVDAVYDDDGTLHIVYNTLDYRPGDGTYNIPCDLVHWNDARGTSRTIATTEHENTCSEQDRFTGGAWNQHMAKANVVVKPASTPWLNGQELIYAVWVQFGPTDVDCATQDSIGTLGGMPNGELYYSVSSNDGLTWDRPQNFTGTVTPDCLPGDCSSEHWVSAAAWADSGVYVSYVEDTHAGGIVQNNQFQEGMWSTSPYRILALEARAPVLEPRISVSPTQFTELNVLPNASTTVDLTINNVGNADLTFEVVVTNDDGGGSHVLVNGSGNYQSSIPAAGAPDVITVTYDGQGLANPSEWNWRLEVTSNDATNDPGQGGTPIDVNLNVFVADPWYTCVSDTISTGLHRLAVGSCLELGDQNGGGGLYAYADSTEWLFDASPVLARAEGPTQYAFRDIFWNSIEDRGRDSNRAFRAQSNIGVTRTVSGDVAFGTATTTDSLIQLDWVVQTFKTPGLQQGAVAKYAVTNRTGATISGIHLGTAADFDIDSASAENDGIADETNQYVGARGGFYDTSGTIYTPLPNYAAMFAVALDEACAGTAVGGQVLDNEDYVYPEDAYNTDTLYNWMATMPGWGANTFSADTITDVNVVMADQQDLSLGPDDTLNYAFGLAVSRIDENDLVATIKALREAVNPACASSCPITLTGDVNLSTTVTAADIIYLVGFVFKGGPAPQPCTASGDVNCSGTVTAADIIYLVGFVFKGGPAPCDACTVIDSYPDC